MKKILVIIILVFSFVNIVFAEDLDIFYRASLLEISKEQDIIKFYPTFLNSIKYEKDYTCETVCQTRFIGNADKLIIGCSPVSYLSLYGGDLVNSFKYDLIGFGGIDDKEVTTWFSYIDKKYNRIVIWGAVNDIMDAISDGRELDDSYFMVLDRLLAAAKKHLNNSPKSQIVYMKVKHMTKNDAIAEDYMEKFNNMADRINNYVARKRGVVLVDVMPKTDKENSEWFLHYNNKYAFMEVLNNIEYECEEANY